MQPSTKAAIPAVSVISKPKHALLPPDVSAASLMRLPAVVAATGAAASTIWTWCRQGKFPEPVRFGGMTIKRKKGPSLQRAIITAWRASDVLAWLADPEAWRADHATQRAAELGGAP